MSVRAAFLQSTISTQAVHGTQHSVVIVRLTVVRVPVSAIKRVLMLTSKAQTP